MHAISLRLGSSGVNRAFPSPLRSMVPDFADVITFNPGLACVEMGTVDPSGAPTAVKGGGIFTTTSSGVRATC